MNIELPKLGDVITFFDQDIVIKHVIAETVTHDENHYIVRITVSENKKDYYVTWKSKPQLITNK